MRLYINGKYLTQRVTGVQRFAAGVVNAWDRGIEEGWIPASTSITIIAPSNLQRDVQFQHIRVVKSETTGRLWEQIELPIRTRGGVLFSPYAAAPVFAIRHIATIHDAGAKATPEQYSWAFQLYCAVVYQMLGVTARQVLTVSEFSKSELHKYFGIPMHKMTAVSLGAEDLCSRVPDFSIVSRLGLKAGKFVLGVSSRSPIKNFSRLMEAWRLCGYRDLKLVIAGADNQKVFGTSKQDFTDTVLAGYVSDEELSALYRSAALFVYPSLYEGFGLPPVEAMSCGCPVLVANSSSLPEICGNGAAYCNPYSVKDIARNIKRVLDHEDLCLDLKRKGQAHARRYTFDGCARVIWSIIQKYGNTSER